MYLVTTSSSLIGAHPNIGVIVGPRVGGIRPVIEGRKWAADNDAFHGRFDPTVFENHLARLAPYRDHCLFVTTPDVRPEASPQPALDTLRLFGTWAPIIRDTGLPVAFVAQDGSEQHPLPDADVLFIGGADTWRGEWTAEMTRRAKGQGMRVHVGRVNSCRRLHAVAALGADTCDGTYISRRAVQGHGIQRGLREVAGWLDTIKEGLWAS